MAYQPWHLGAIEEAGYMDTNTSLIDRVANYLADSPNDTIETEEFREACIACGVAPDSFSQSGLARLQRRPEQIAESVQGSHEESAIEKNERKHSI